MNKTKIYETALELIFTLENYLNEDITDIKYMFDKNEKHIPFAIEISSSSTKCYSLQSIINLINHIPIIISASTFEYNYITTNNVVKCLTDYEKYKKYYDEYISYIDTMSLNVIDENTIDYVITLLCDNDIYFDENDNEIILYEPESLYNIILPKRYTNKNYKYSVNISSKENSKHESFEINNTKIYSIGKFIFFNDVKSINEYQYALILKCTNCDKNIIVNYNPPTHTLCPFCNSINVF